MKPSEKFIFESTIGFSECHASTIEVVGETIVCAWFGGTKEGNNDVAIWQSIRNTNGTWTEPATVADTPGVPHWNPVLFFDQGVLYLFYRIGESVEKWQSCVKRSTDGGQTYSEASFLPENILGPIKNKPIRMSNGEWLSGSSVEPPGDWYCQMETYSPTTGSWSCSEELRCSIMPDVPYVDKECNRIIQPAVWESTPGNIHAFLRSNKNCLYRTDSTDFGRNWSSPVPTDIPNPNSGIDIAKLADGRLVLACNPVPWDNENYFWGPRSPLSLLISEDNGKTWPVRKDLETEKLTREDGGFSYPSIIPYGDGVALVYSWHLRKIRFHIIPSKDL